MGGGGRVDPEDAVRGEAPRKDEFVGFCSHGPRTTRPNMAKHMSLPSTGKGGQKGRVRQSTIWSSQSTRPGGLLSSGRIQALEGNNGH